MTSICTGRSSNTQRAIAAIGALALFCAPSIAQAQSCYALTQQRAAMRDRMTRLVTDYPGTHLVIGMCAASAASVEERTHNSNAAMQEFTACATIGCLFAGFGNCAAVTAQWFRAALESQELDRRLRNC